MFCSNCGKKTPDKARICPYCGSPLNKGIQKEDENLSEAGEIKADQVQAEEVNEELASHDLNSKEEVVEEPRAEKVSPQQAKADEEAREIEALYAQAEELRKETRKKASIKKFLPLIIGIPILAVVGFYFVFLKPLSINLDKYTSVEFNGYNGYAMPYIKLDYELLAEEKGDKLRKLALKSLESQGQRDYLALMTNEDLTESIVDTFALRSLDKKYNLSNGDEVNLVWNIDNEAAKKELNLVLKAKDKSYKVKDLEDPSHYNVFENLKLKYGGIAPYGYLDLDDMFIEVDGRTIEGLRIQPDTYYDLDNGQMIKLTVYVWDQPAEENSFIEDGIILDKLSEKHTVSGLAEYIRRFADIPASSMDKLVKKGEELIRSKEELGNYREDISIEAVRHIGDSLGVRRRNNLLYVNNILINVYEVDLRLKNDEDDIDDRFSIYFTCQSNDLAVDGDGNFVEGDDYNYLPAANKFIRTYDMEGYSNTRVYFNGYTSIEELEAMLESYERNFEMDTKLSPTGKVEAVEEEEEVLEEEEEIEEGENQEEESPEEDEKKDD